MDCLEAASGRGWSSGHWVRAPKDKDEPNVPENSNLPDNQRTALEGVQITLGSLGSLAKGAMKRLEPPLGPGLQTINISFRRSLGLKAGRKWSGDQVVSSKWSTFFPGLQAGLQTTNSLLNLWAS